MLKRSYLVAIVLTCYTILLLATTLLRLAIWLPVYYR